jgi:hypothetical protein
MNYTNEERIKLLAQLPLLARVRMDHAKQVMSQDDYDKALIQEAKWQLERKYGKKL